jgi:hypothetical protein
MNVFQAISEKQGGSLDVGYLRLRDEAFAAHAEVNARVRALSNGYSIIPFILTPFSDTTQASYKNFYNDPQNSSQEQTVINAAETNLGAYYGTNRDVISGNIGELKEAIVRRGKLFKCLMSYVKSIESNDQSATTSQVIVAFRSF